MNVDPDKFELQIYQQKNENIFYGTESIVCQHNRETQDNMKAKIRRKILVNEDQNIPL